MASAEGYLAGDSIQRFRRYLETVKESGICWFESNNGHHWVTAHPESGRGSIPQGRCVRLAVQWFKLSFISLVTDSAGKDKAPPPVRLRKEGSRSQTTEIGTVIADGIGTINCRVWMHKARNVSRRIER